MAPWCLGGKKIVSVGVSPKNIFMPDQKIIYQVDAFTREPFRGNPAGVCILESEPEPEWMQNIAMEMNLSETAFLFPGDGQKREIRFFSPAAEIDLCGHATLSASHIMYEHKYVDEKENIYLHSKAGDLSVRKDGVWITMNFPAYNYERMEVTGEFARVTGIEPLELYRAAFGWTMALLRDESEVKAMNPDFRAMKDSTFGDLIVTAPPEGTGYDFCVRCFAPALGIDEDPVTGSAHCALAPFWHMKTGKSEFISHQVSKRGGLLKVALKDNRVEISGMAKTIFRAELLI